MMLSLAIAFYKMLVLIKLRLVSESLCSQKWPQTPDPLAPASQVLGLEACATMPSHGWQRLLKGNAKGMVYEAKN